MKCPECNTEVGLRKSLGKSPSGYPDTCPDCGAELEKDDGGSRLSSGPDMLNKTEDT